MPKPIGTKKLTPEKLPSLHTHPAPQRRAPPSSTTHTDSHPSQPAEERPPPCLPPQPDLSREPRALTQGRNHPPRPPWPGSHTHSRARSHTEDGQRLEPPTRTHPPAPPSPTAPPPEGASPHRPRTPTPRNTRPAQPPGPHAPSAQRESPTLHPSDLARYRRSPQSNQMHSRHRELRPGLRVAQETGGKPHTSAASMCTSRP
jgi:hypothetical protein